ncbi:uncharacterized protein BDR25DRAFT_343469 [Lindgomyces ingoldianus]|uniref:Uncharacterized protein n=1 Tax=Lindgomyces ingoldianus TaxID=673940 RepID=A0ACB6QTZ8_9PLEO|nr:uncharacterized protein BDR25DRAFT_343469 [Lindgomyces ingoldianus]KAF2469767.1 hypothetical protein BDR25DRAFT_343469 [Lindgomyces ingoldianus]
MEKTQPGVVSQHGPDSQTPSTMPPSPSLKRKDRGDDVASEDDQGQNHTAPLMKRQKINESKEVLHKSPKPPVSLSTPTLPTPTQASTTATVPKPEQLLTPLPEAPTLPTLVQTSKQDECPIDWAVTKLANMSAELKGAYILRAPWKGTPLPFTKIAETWNELHGENKSPECLRKRFKHANVEVFKATGTFYSHSLQGINQLVPEAGRLKPAGKSTQQFKDSVPKVAQTTPMRVATQRTKRIRVMTKSEVHLINFRIQEKQTFKLETEQHKNLVKIKIGGEVYRIKNHTERENKEIFQFLCTLPTGLVKQLRSVNDYMHCPRFCKWPQPKILNPLYFNKEEQDNWGRYPNHRRFGLDDTQVDVDEDEQ